MEIGTECRAEGGDLSKRAVAEVLIGVEVTGVFVGNEVESKTIKINIRGRTNLFETSSEVRRESIDGSTNCSIGNGLASNEIVTEDGEIVGVERKPIGGSEGERSVIVIPCGL